VFELSWESEAGIREELPADQGRGSKQGHCHAGQHAFCQTMCIYWLRQALHGLAQKCELQHNVSSPVSSHCTMLCRHTLLCLVNFMFSCVFSIFKSFALAKAANKHSFQHLLTHVVSALDFIASHGFIVVFCVQFGKVDSYTYIMDYNPAEITAIQAFAISLSTFDTKLLL